MAWHVLRLLRARQQGGFAAASHDVVAARAFCGVSCWGDDVRRSQPLCTRLKDRRVGKCDRGLGRALAGMARRHVLSCDCEYSDSYECEHPVSPWM